MRGSGGYSDSKRLAAPMSRSPRVPSYRYHKASRQAVVVIRGRSFYLGPWNSPESKAEYRRVVAEYWSVDRRPSPAAIVRPPVEAVAPAGLTIDELLVS